LAIKKKRTHIYLLLPLYAYYGLFFLVPLGILFIYSFWLTSTTKIIPIFTLHNYIEMFTKELYRTIIFRSLYIGLVIGLLCVLLSYPLAYALTFKYKKLQDAILYLILISLFSNYLVRVYAWKTILGNYGFINQILTYLGIIKQPLEFLLYSKTAVVITLVFILVPYTILPIFSSLQNVSIDLIEAAKDLGANSARAFFKITLPLSMPGVTTGFIFSFILSAGDYVTPQLVGGNSGLMIGRIISDQFGQSYNWPLGSAISYMMIFLMIIIINIFIWITRILKLRS
jgi:spermidine/putrescine transport system permease protein